MLLLLAAGVACPPRPRTQLIVIVTGADEETRRPETTVDLQAELLRPPRTNYGRSNMRLSDPRGPLWVASFVPDDPSADNRLKITATIVRDNGGTPLHVTQVAEVSLEEQHTLMLIMSMSFRCLSMPCDPQTCAGLPDGGVGCIPVARRGVPYDPAALSVMDASSEPPDATLDAPDAGDARVVLDASDVFDAGDAPDVSDAMPPPDVTADADVGDAGFGDPENCGGAVCNNLQVCVEGRCTGALTVRSISLHSRGGCALMSDGTLRCWGQSQCSAAFLSPTRDTRVPSRVLGVRGVTAFAAAEAGLCWVVDRVVHCCGNLGGPTRLNLLGEVDALAAGEQHACALLDGGVMCGGANSAGQCGDGTTSVSTAGPVTVLLPARAASLYAGLNNSCAITTTGEIYCWGESSAGQLGADLDGGVCMADGSACPRPQRVAGITAARQVATGGNDPLLAGACAVTQMGQLQCWGSGPALGYGASITRQEVPGAAIDLGGATVRQVARGASHTCVLEDSGRVRCWGSREHGHLGDGIDDMSATSSPGASAVIGLGVGSGVTQIEARSDHTCVVRDGSEIRCWGRNDTGQLGDGTTTDRAMPVTVRW